MHTHRHEHTREHTREHTGTRAHMCMHTHPMPTHTRVLLGLLPNNGQFSVVRALPKHLGGQGGHHADVNHPRLFDVRLTKHLGQDWEEEDEPRQ